MITKCGDKKNEKNSHFELEEFFMIFKYCDSRKNEYQNWIEKENYSNQSTEEKKLDFEMNTFISQSQFSATQIIS